MCGLNSVETRCASLVWLAYFILFPITITLFFLFFNLLNIRHNKRPFWVEHRRVIHIKRAVIEGNLIREELTDLFEIYAAFFDQWHLLLPFVCLDAICLFVKKILV